uniref:Uncharacterized protein n=1 Tax=Gouania willdenowi TaxID=441366 RepID=A0A8C5NBJ2_GOUWI
WSRDQILKVLVLSRTLKHFDSGLTCVTHSYVCGYGVSLDRGAQGRYELITVKIPVKLQKTITSNKYYLPGKDSSFNNCGVQLVVGRLPTDQVF